MSIGSRIKSRRLSKNKTLEWLAEQVGTTRQTIHRYETGEITNIPSDKIEAIAKALDTSPSILMGWDEEDRFKSNITLHSVNLKYIFQDYHLKNGHLFRLFENYYNYFYSEKFAKHSPSSKYSISNVEQLIRRFLKVYNGEVLLTENEIYDFNCISGSLYRIDSKKYNTALESDDVDKISFENKIHGESKSSSNYSIILHFERELGLKYINKDISYELFLTKQEEIESIKKKDYSSEFESFKKCLEDISLIKFSQIVPYEKSCFIEIPLYELLSCGKGLFVDDNISEYITLPISLLNRNKDYFCQFAVGDSMINENINEGDLLVFEKTSYIENGQIGCFCIDDNIATCKKFYKDDASAIITLQPANPKYAPIIVTVENMNFHVVGKLSLVINKRD